MMRKWFLVVLIFFISFSGVYSQEIALYDAHVTVEGVLLKEDISISIRNNHETPIRKLTYPFSGQVRNLKTFDDIGGLESEVELRGGKNYVTTDLRDSLDIMEATTVLVEFEDPASVVFFNNTFILSTSFPLLANVKTFALTLRLPEGTGVFDPEVDIVPAPSEITSDGRSVILKWAENDPSDFRIFVRYEPLPAPTQTPPTTTPPTPNPKKPLLQNESVILVLVSLLFVSFIALLLLKVLPKKRIDEKIDILKEDEQLILKMVAEDDGVEQREIQRMTDFSKTKVSKILAELEKRGAITKESMGKKNRIYLTQKLKE